MRLRAVMKSMVSTARIERDDVFVTAGVAGDADGFDRQEDGEGLAGFVVEAGGFEFLGEDVVRQAQGVGVFFFQVGRVILIT